MYSIGITGGSGAGKTTALQVLGQMGAAVLDCDQIYHALLQEDAAMQAEIAAQFPTAVTDGKVQRHILAGLAFGAPAALADLNQITHQYVRRAVTERLDKLAQSGTEAVAIEAVALIESGLANVCDVVIGITAPPDLRLERILQRENVTREYAEQRIAAQQPDTFYKAHCNYILENAYQSREEFRVAAKAFFGGLIAG